MKDPRIEKYADVLVNYCVSLKKGQLVMINGSHLAEPLIKELYRKIILAGAYPHLRISLEGLDEIYFKNGVDDQFKFISPLQKYETEKIQAVISIISPFNTKGLSNIDPKKQAVVNKARAPLFKRFMEREQKKELSWVGCQYPTLASAQDAKMSLTEYEDFVFVACKLDKNDPVAEWKKISKYNANLIKYLKTRKSIHIVAPDTDLTYSVAGRKWVNCDGLNNFPDGEVFTGPIENSANGYIRFSFPAEYGGREIEDVRVEFKDGKAVKATATKGEDFLNAMLDMDKGSRHIGELAIGTNFEITKFTMNTLFDEKIGGTCHMAFGAGFPETGSKNVSGLHWDMVCDLRKGGELYGDGQLFFKNGKFLK